MFNSFRPLLIWQRWSPQKDNGNPAPFNPFSTGPQTNKNKYRDFKLSHTVLVFHICQCPESFLQTIRNMDDYQDYNMSTETPTEKSLIRLHCKLIRASQNQFRTRCQWNMLIEKALELDDVAANETNTDKKFRKALGQNNYHQIFRMVYTPTVGEFLSPFLWDCLPIIN